MMQAVESKPLIDIQINEDAWHMKEMLVHDAVSSCLAFIPRLHSIDFSLSVILTNNDNVRILNKKFRQKDKPTNVLSFPQFEREEPFDLPEIHLGDLVFAYGVILQESQEQNKSFNDHFKHLIVHGFLHLLGYDHINDKDADEMEALEIKILEKMGLKNPYIL